MTNESEFTGPQMLEKFEKHRNNPHLLETVLAQPHFPAGELTRIFLDNPNQSVAIITGILRNPNSPRSLLLTLSRLGLDDSMLCYILQHPKCDSEIRENVKDRGGVIAAKYLALYAQK